MMRFTKQQILRLISLLGFILVAESQIVSAFSSKELLVFFGFGGDDHETMTVVAISNVGSAYPDIQKFSSEIKNGASDEGIVGIGSHDRITGESPQFWGGNEDEWRKEFLRKYNRLEFSDAYQRLGLVVHLIEDAEVPAHRTFNFHGVSGTYERSPTDSTNISGSAHLDYFEQFASNNHDSSVPPTVSIDSVIVDPKTGCPSKFWIGPDDDGDSPPNSAGAYGRLEGVPCTAPFLVPTTAEGIDWFADPPFTSIINPILFPVSITIARGQLFNARVNAEQEMKSRSQSLAALIKDLTISGAPLGGSNQLSISFTILDNRTANATYTIGLFREDGTFVGNIRENTPITLTQVPGAALPFEATLSGITWDGKIDGTSVADGNYKLDVRATDGDGNPTPDEVNQDNVTANDTTVSFNIADPLFLVGGRKLIFPERTDKTRENSGPPGFYHRA